MRTEIGEFINLGKEANEAYKTYASLYLDWVDDNMSHFTWRKKDLQPWEELEETVGHEVSDEAMIAKAYLNAAVSIAKTVPKDDMTKQELIRNYPLLEGLF